MVKNSIKLNTNFLNKEMQLKELNSWKNSKKLEEILNTINILKINNLKLLPILNNKLKPIELKMSILKWPMIWVAVC
jgi:hypothetical protein